MDMLISNVDGAIDGWVIFFVTFFVDDGGVTDGTSEGPNNGDWEGLILGDADHDPLISSSST
jgi:hypothetical protein